MKNEKLSTLGDMSMCPTAVLVRDDHILLGIRNYTPDKWKAVSVWTTPGGRCNPDETLEGTLRREIQEEVGITDIQIHDFIGEVPGAKEGGTVPVFFCTTKQNATLMEPEKFSEWRWVPMSDYLAGGEWSEMNPEAHAMISQYLKNKRSQTQK